MVFHHVILVIGESSRLAQYPIGHGDLANIVQRTGRSQSATLLVIESKFSRQQEGETGYIFRSRM